MSKRSTKYVLIFLNIYDQLTNGPMLDSPYFIKDGYMLFGTRLCIPRTFEYLLLDVHAGGAVGHHGRDQTLALVVECFY